MAKSAIATSSINQFNNLAERAAAKGAETLALIWKAGEIAKEAKESLVHGEWEAFVENNYSQSLRTVRRWIQFHNSVPESKTATVADLSAGLKMIEAPKPKKKPKPKGGKAGTDSGGTDTQGQEEDPQPPEEGTDEQGDEETVDYGKCPNCLGTKWEEDEFGVSCVKCGHPHGEPAGDVDKERITTQRQKTVKTAEALMRAFDDLNRLQSSTSHEGAVKLCKAALQIAKSWK